MNSKALAHAVPPVAVATNGAGTRMPTLARPAASQTKSPPAPASGGVDFLVGDLLRSFQVLISAMRLYQRNHPSVTENLESVERSLRAAFRQCRAIDLRVERDGMALVASREQSAPVLDDPRGELRNLAVELTDAGVHTLEFLPRINLSELELFARAVDATSRAANLHRGGRRAGNRNWSVWLAEHQVSGIRVNAPAERRADDTVLGILVGALPSAERHGIEAEAFPASTLEQLREALRFLATAAPRLQLAQRQPPQGAARIVREEVASASPHTLGLLKSGLVIDPPQPDDTAGSYFARLADTLALDFLRAGYQAGRIRALEVRHLINELSLCGAPAIDEAQIETRIEHFWSSLPAREVARVLASRDAWCIPVPVLRRYLEPLIAAAERKSAEASGREARRALADFVCCVECEEEKGRRAAAAGLIELAGLLERLWPHPRFGEITRRVVDALLRETSPGIAGLLAAATETLARLALERGAYAEFEGILDGLQAPRNGNHEPVAGPIAALARRIVAQERWLLLVDRALANRSLDPALPKLLRRDPERLLDRLGLLLTSPEGADALPAMARLVRVTGEPVLGTLQSHLTEPRRQRVATAIKLLAAVQPERLVEALPRALAAWDWSLQDLAVSELARQPQGPLRKRIAEVFLATLPEAHVYVVSSMLDQIALAGESSAVPLLIEITAGKVDALRDLFIRIKAIETLGHLRAGNAAPVLLELVRSRAGLTYAEPAGLRSAAEEALALIENRPSSARLRAAKEAGEKSSSRFERPRRYVRVRLPSPLPARIAGPRAAAAIVHVIALGGALIETKGRLAIGETVHIEIRSGLRHIGTTAVVRSVSPAGYGVEFVHMKQEDREKLRVHISKLLR